MTIRVETITSDHDCTPAWTAIGNAIIQADYLQAAHRAEDLDGVGEIAEDAMTYYLDGDLEAASNRLDLAAYKIRVAGRKAGHNDHWTAYGAVIAAQTMIKAEVLEVGKRA